MPLIRCSVDGKSGWKWGDSGKCFLAREDALEQAKAILTSQLEPISRDTKLADADVITSGTLVDADPTIFQIAIELAEFRACFSERVAHLATKDDIAELRGLIAQSKVEQKLSAKHWGAIVTSVTAALSALATAVYAATSR